MKLIKKIILIIFTAFLYLEILQASEILLQKNGIIITSLDLENYTLKLYNSFGQLVQVEQLRNANNSISTLNFPVGMYFIQLFNNEKSITKSFLKW